MAILSSSTPLGKYTAGLSTLTLSLLLSAIAAAQSYTFDLKWGTSGTGDGQFLGLGGIAVDASGDLYVADSSSDRIQKFDFPVGVAVDASGNVYVAELGNDRIQKFNPPPPPPLPVAGLLGLSLLGAILALGAIRYIRRRA